jgi:hypothetical protein
MNIFDKPSYADIAEQMTLMERMVKLKQIRYDSDLYHKSLHNFQQNLISIIEEANQYPVKIILSTVTSNIHDQQPFADELSPDIDPEEWQYFYEKASLNLREADLDSAAFYFLKCLKIDSLSASPHFGLAKVFEEKDDSIKSYHHYYLAKDLDALRFRASEDLNQIITEISDQAQLPLADIKLEFENASPHRLPGNNLFLEHLHPNIDGYYLMARSFYQTIVNSKIISDSCHEISFDQSNFHNLGITALDEELGRIRVKILTSGWPFKHAKIGSLADFDSLTGDIVQDLAKKYWKNEISWEEAHVILAEHYEKKNLWDQASGEYQALIVGTPYNPSPSYRLAQILLKEEKFEAVSLLLHRLLGYHNDILVYKLLAQTYLEKDEPAKALIYLDAAHKINKEDKKILRLMVSAYDALEDTLNSMKTLKYLRELNSKN